LFLEALWEMGTLGAEELDPEGEVRLLAYFNANKPLEVLRNQVETSLLDMGCGEGRISFHRLRYDGSAWIEKFNTTFVGFEVTPTFWVYPPWDRSSDRHSVNILLEPGHGFGTGTHESTQMAMEAVAKCVRDCATMLDYGTGSGILTVAAAKLRPGLRIVAFDIDPLAVNAAAKTLQFNDLDELDLFVGEGGSLKGPFDLVVANLTAAIIFTVAADLERLSGRYLIVAGFTVSEVEFVTSVLLDAGPFAERNRWVKNDWACLLLERCEE
jgi:ribosomal protein L11 methyltransferase